MISSELREHFREIMLNDVWPIYLFGAAGRGKTFAMSSFYRHWHKEIPRPLWVDFQPWLRNLMIARRDGTVSVSQKDGQSYEWSETRLLKNIADASLLCLDDCGIRADSEAQQSAFLEILNVRQGKPTLITGNHEPEQLHKVFDSRIASRLMAGVMLKFNGKDRRMFGTKVIEID